VSVDFTVSPRIVEIALPSTTITIQDLYDTLRTIEARLHNLNFPALIDNLRSTGKQTLSATKQLGLTVTLRNARIMFADRLGPSHSNTEIVDGNLVATDGTEPPTFIDPIEPAAFINTKLELDVSAALINANVENFWDALRAAHVIPGSFGALMGNPNMEKGVAFFDCPVVMLSATNLTPLPGLTVTGEISFDQVNFAALAEADGAGGATLVEVEKGLYVVTQLTAAEMNHNAITLRLDGGPTARIELVTYFPNPS